MAYQHKQENASLWLAPAKVSAILYKSEHLPWSDTRQKYRIVVIFLYENTYSFLGRPVGPAWLSLYFLVCSGK